MPLVRVSNGGSEDPLFVIANAGASMSQTRTTTVPKGISSYKYLVLFNCQAANAYDVLQRGSRVVAVDDFVRAGQAILNMDGSASPSGYYNTYTYVDENTISYSSNSGFCCGMAVLC